MDRLSLIVFPEKGAFGFVCPPVWGLPDGFGPLGPKEDDGRCYHRRAAHPQRFGAVKDPGERPGAWFASRPSCLVVVSGYPPVGRFFYCFAVSADLTQPWLASSVFANQAYLHCFAQSRIVLGVVPGCSGLFRIIPSRPIGHTFTVSHFRLISYSLGSRLGHPSLVSANRLTCDVSHFRMISYSFGLRLACRYRASTNRVFLFILLCMFGSSAHLIQRCVLSRRFRESANRTYFYCFAVSADLTQSWLTSRPSFLGTRHSGILLLFRSCA